MTCIAHHARARSTLCFIAAALLAIAVAGCGGSVGGPAPAPVSSAAGSSIAAATPASETVTPTSEAPPSPTVTGWRSIPIVDVRTGATIRVADLNDKVVVVELMATWCPPCLEQQREVLIARRQLDLDRVAFVSIDADTRENAATIRSYAERHGFDWVYAVGPPALLRELADIYGIEVLDPPATPIVIIATDGSTRLTETGLKTADRLVELIRAAGA